MQERKVYQPQHQDFDLANIQEIPFIQVGIFYWSTRWPTVQENHAQILAQA